MIERIAQFIDKLSISVSVFEKNIGASEGVIRRAIKNNSDIQSKWIVNISDKYPNLNPDWLLTGKGEMLRKEESDPKDHVPEVGNMVSLEEYKAQVKATTRLEIELEQCQEQIKVLEKTINQLKSTGSGVDQRELKKKD